MRSCLVSLVLGLALFAPQAKAAPLVALFADVVEPDAALTEFLGTLVQTARAGLTNESSNYSVLDSMIAPDLQGFSRGLDPLEAWRKLDLSSDSESGVALLTTHMVEMGDLPEGATNLPDYRQDMLEILVALIANPAEPLGTLPETGDAICSPARYAFDAKATAAFAAAHDTDAYSISIYPRDLALYAEPSAAAPVSATLSARTLLLSEYVAGQPDDWTKVITSDGQTGWVEDTTDREGLSQQHLCFDKVDGAYKIVAFYSYGL